MMRVRKLAWWALGINVGVILLGALVRATGSGAGCGRSWPSCNGEILPSFENQATAIEFLHRSTSGIALLVVLVLYVQIRARHGRGEVVRRAGFVSVLAIIGEALIGAGIVLFEWVADDASVARTIAVPLHLVNTLLLLAALAVVLAASDGRPFGRLSDDTRRRVRWGLIGLVAVAATGAVAALADTLYPATSLAEGLAEDFSSTSTWLTRLRIVHPVVATLTGIGLVWVVSQGRERTGRSARIVVWLVVAQVGAGVLNVVLLVPVWMQLVHLLLADLLWIAFIWYVVESMRQSAATTSS